jgi:tetratricopeptide (TPR) repeat protein
MRKTCISICLIITFINCFGQKKTDWQKNGLKGRVKSITTTVYNATEKFGEPVKDGIKEKSEIITIQFDTKGKIIPPSKGDNVVYKYDTKGNITEETAYGSDNSTIISKSVFKYDASSNVIEELNYDSQGELKEKKVNTYDANGNLLVYKKSGSLFNGTRNQGQALVTKYKYDAYGRPIQVSVGIGDDSELGSENYKYDTKGDVIETTAETFNGVNVKKTYKYIYDANGNWITKVSFSSSAYRNMKAESKADEIIERVIEYHKEQAQIDKEYKELIAKANSSFASKNYSEAIDYYQQSLLIKNDQSIKEQITNAQKLQIDNNYQKQISVADLAFNEKNYTSALTEYKKAVEIKDEQYPKDKLKETQEKIDEEKRRKEAEEKRIAEEKARKEKVEAAVKKGNNFFETKKFKEALAEYNSANAIEVSNDVTAKIQSTQKEIDRIDSLQKLRLEIYSYLKTHNETIATEMTSLKVSLTDKKKVYGEHYELCMNFLNSNFSSYFSSVNTMFSTNKTTGLKTEDSWNETDQDALDLLTKFKEEFKLYEKFHTAVKTAFDTENKDRLKILKSSDDPKEIISKF